MFTFSIQLHVCVYKCRRVTVYVCILNLGGNLNVLVVDEKFTPKCRPTISYYIWSFFFEQSAKIEVQVHGYSCKRKSNKYGQDIKKHAASPNIVRIGNGNHTNTVVTYQLTLRLFYKYVCVWVRGCVGVPCLR